MSGGDAVAAETGIRRRIIGEIVQRKETTKDTGRRGRIMETMLAALAHRAVDGLAPKPLFVGASQRLGIVHVLETT